MSNKRNYGPRGVGLTSRGRRSSKSLLKHHRPGEKMVNRNAPGKEGAINGYACPECKKVTVVMHRDAGVTPMMLACRMTENCTGRAYSLGYPPNPPDRVVKAVRYIWCRPDQEEFNKMSREMKDHIKRGGLELRPINPDT